MREREGNHPRTWWQTLLQLIGLVGILQDEGVDETVAADLELDLLGLAVTLDARGWREKKTNISDNSQSTFFFFFFFLSFKLAHSSMNSFHSS